MAYSKQTWDTTSYVNPTRMNHIEQGIYDVAEVISKLETGQSNSITINANSYSDLTINFTGTHTSNAMVICNLKSTGDNPDNVTAWNNINLVVLPLTTSTSAKVRIFNSNSAINISAYVSYIVIG